MAAKIRFFTQTNQGWYQQYWSDVGREWLKALVAAGLEVKAVSSTVLDLADEKSPWHEVEQHFLTPLTKRFTNVVCGFGDDFKRLHEEGELNIAITGLKPREPSPTELAALKNYNHRLWVERNTPNDLIKLIIARGPR